MARKEEVFGVTVEGDISGLRKAMNDAVRVFNSTERSLKNVNKALELDPTDEKMLAKQRDLYKKAIQENEKALKELYEVRKNIVNDPNFKAGMTDMTEKFTSVEKKIKEVTKEGEKLRKELKGLPSDNVAKIEDKFKKLAESVKKSKESLEKIKASLKNVNEQIKLDPTNLELYTKKTTLLNDELRVTETAIRNIKKRQDSLRNSEGFQLGNNNTRKEWTENALLLAQLEKRAKELRLEIKGQLSPAMSAFVNVMGNIGEKLVSISEKTKALSRAFQVLGVASLKSAMDYESNIANIQRVVHDLSDKTIADLKDIAIETGSAFKDIADYAAIGGALGLADEQLSKFSRTMIDLNTATGGVFAGEEGAKGIAVFLKQLNLGIDQAENFGSAIAVIGDKYADIGDETVNVATRLTGLTAIIETNQYELLGLAGVMADLGLATDSNANGINRAFLQIDKVIGGGVKNSSEKLEEMAKVAGYTSKEFREAWGKNAVDAFLRFTDGLKSTVFNEINDAVASSDDKVLKYAETLDMTAEQFRRLWGEDSHKLYERYIDSLESLGEEGEVASKVLSDLGISSVNTAQTMLRLAGNGNEVRKAIELTKDAWLENTALTEKSGIIYETTASKLKGFWESLKQLGDAIGREVLPDLKKLTDGATELVKNFSKLDPTTRSLIAKFIGLGAVFSPMTKLVGKLIDKDHLGGLLHFIKMLGGIETLTLIAVLGSLYQTLAQYEQFQAYVSGMESIRTETDNLNKSLLESVSLADQNYRAKEQQLDLLKREAASIDYLIERLEKEKLTESERAKIKEEITGYVNDLNEALGAEVFHFDTVSGKITAQGQEIDTVRGKFAELSADLKKETWLEAHKGVLEQAYNDLDTSTAKMDEATSNYIAEAQKIPDGVRAVLEDFNGSLQEFQTMLDANMIQYDPNQVEGWYKTWAEYHKTIQDTQTLIDNANNVIDSYMLVADANVETLDSRISAATEAINIMQEGVTNTDDTLDLLVEKRDAYASTLTDEQKTNDILLEQYDKQIEKLKIQNEYESKKYGWALETKTQIQEYIDTNNAWQPQDKHQNIYVHYIGLQDGFGIGGSTAISVGRGTGSRSGGFGSFGYGDLLKNTMSSIKNALGNFRSGGFASGGITVNANFTVNSNNVGRNEVRTWSSWIIDDLNEALGKQL